MALIYSKIEMITSRIMNICKFNIYKNRLLVSGTIYLLYLDIYDKKDKINQNA